MKIKALRNFSIKGMSYQIGDELKIADREGKFLINIGKAVAVEETAAPLAAENRDSDIQERTSTRYKKPKVDELEGGDAE